MIIENITQKPVKIQTEWIEKTITTTPTTYIPHQEFSWRCYLSSEDRFYGVLLLCYENIIEFQKFFTEDSRLNLEVTLAFFPHDWKNSNLVQISLYQSISSTGGGAHINVEDKILKENPKSLVTIRILKESIMLTGDLIHLATVRSAMEINAKLLMIDQADTESTHGRWRLKSSFREKLPANQKFLHEGRIAGKLVL